MKSIYKYPLTLDGIQVLEIPLSPMNEVLSNLIAAGIDPSGSLVVWCRIDTDAPTRRVAIQVCGTGLVIPDGKLGDWLASVQDGQFVWHVFARCLRH